MKKNKTDETQKKFVGADESISGRSSGAGFDTQAPALALGEEKDKSTFIAITDDDKEKDSFGKNSILSPDKNKSIVESQRIGSQKKVLSPVKEQDG